MTDKDFVLAVYPDIHFEERVVSSQCRNEITGEHFRVNVIAVYSSNIHHSNKFICTLAQKDPNPWKFIRTIIERKLLEVFEK